MLSTMPLLRSSLHPEHIRGGTEMVRHAVRAIITHQDQILLLYTRRYDDYSLPGGGVDLGESLEQALLREVAEETGAKDVALIESLGRYDELRPWYKPEYDNQRIHSYCYWCQANPELGEPQLEDYEQANGMVPVWIAIEDAIAHNLRIIASSDKAGMSVERELWLLQHIQQRLQQAA